MAVRLKTRRREAIAGERPDIEKAAVDILKLMLR